MQNNEPLDPAYAAKLLADAEEQDTNAEKAAAVVDQTGDLPTLAAELAACKDELDRLSAEKSLVQARHDHLRYTAIPERMEALGLTRSDGKGSFDSAAGKISLRREIYTQVLAADREALYDYLRKNGAGDLIRETVNDATLKAHVKALKEEGAELPPMVKITEGMSVTLVRAKR